MSLIDISRKAAVYGCRHILQNCDSRLMRGLAAPERVAMVLTNRCNCRCVMCDLWRTTDGANELSAERWMAVLDDLHVWTRTLRLHLVGGEVLLKPGVYDIIGKAVRLGFTTNVYSNGLALQSEENYRSLVNTGLRSITFSLDGKDPATHDYHRGIPGLHNAVTEVIRRIKRDRPAMSVTLICILMRETVPHLAEFTQWAEELGVDRVLFQPLAEPPGRAEKRPEWHSETGLFVRDLAPLDHSIDALSQWGQRSPILDMTLGPLREMREYFVRPESFQISGGNCRLGLTDLQIDPAGILYMCDVSRTTFGHVDDGPIRQSWRSERARAVRREMRMCRRPCCFLCNRSPGLWEKASRFLRYARAGRL